MRKSRLHKIVMIVFGTFLMGIAAYYFYIPYSVNSGGVTGLSILFQKLWPRIPVSAVIFVLNLILFILGLIFLGKEFGFYTFLGGTAYSLWVRFFETVSPAVTAPSATPLVATILGAFLMSLGGSICYLQDASTGGTDIVAKILNTYFHIGLAYSQMTVDGIIVLISGIFLSLEVALHSMVAILVVTQTMDIVLNAAGNKVVMHIITKEVDLVKDFITKGLNRSCTILPAYGGYSGEERGLMVSVLDRKQYHLVNQLLDKVDEEAFVYTQTANEVIGLGFTFVKEDENGKQEDIFSSPRTTRQSKKVVDEFIALYPSLKEKEEKK